MSTAISSAYAHKQYVMLGCDVSPPMSIPLRVDHDIGEKRSRFRIPLAEIDKTIKKLPNAIPQIRELVNKLHTKTTSPRKIADNHDVTNV